MREEKLILQRQGTWGGRVDGIAEDDYPFTIEVGWRIKEWKAKPWLSHG
jgi:hypothetical protein